MLLGGEDPDPRFSLANERTFLAWIRTALALLAGGVGMEAFADGVFAVALKDGLALGLLAMSLLVSLCAFIRWLGVERALRRKESLPLPVLAPVLSLGCLLMGGVLIGVLWSRAG